MLHARTSTDRRLHPYVPAVLATLASGAVMMVGGYLFHRDGWAIAGPVMIPAAPLISIAFALERRAGGRRLTVATSTKLRSALQLIVGLPAPGGNLALATSVAVTAETLLSGAAMALGGYAIASWNPLFVLPIIAAGGMIMTAAFVTTARGEQQHSREAVPRQAITTDREWA